MLEVSLVIILWSYLLVLLILIGAYLSAGAQKGMYRKNNVEDLPPVSILIPARNEALNIEKCMASLLKLDYPKEKLSIFIGEDHSSDETAQLVSNFIAAHPHFKLVSINQTLGTAQAKGNVLANLMRLVQTEIIFVTDADIEVNPNWIKQLLPKILQDGYAMASGTTLVDGTQLFHKWQGLEWYLGTGYIAGFHQLGIPTTAVGNNMAFTKTAYEATGGYENMPFSVTEDFQLYAAIRAKGYLTYNESHADSVNISAAQLKVKSFLHQRKRWLMGARALPWYWLLLFGLQASFYPSLLVLLILHVNLGLKIWAMKIILQQAFILLMQVRLKQKKSLLAFITFEAYSLWSTFAMLGFYIARKPMDWKGRQYN